MSCHDAQARGRVDGWRQDRTSTNVWTWSMEEDGRILIFDPIRTQTRPDSDLDPDSGPEREAQGRVRAVQLSGFEQ